MNSDLERALGLTATQIERLRIFEAEVVRWSKVKNLVSGSAEQSLWVRHILDSVQVQKARPDAKVWVDLGSGGGFPGIVTAIMLADVPDAMTHLVESDKRKCAFLQAVSRETGVRTVVHAERIERVIPTLFGIQAVSARALAPLDQLVAWVDPLLMDGATAVFPKGRTVLNELTRLSAESKYKIDIRPSVTDLDGSLVIIRRDRRSEHLSDKS